MKIKELADTVKAKGAYSKRRASALAEHGLKVVSVGLDAAQQLAAVTLKNLKSAAAAPKAALTDGSLPLRQRIRKARTETGFALANAKSEVSAAASAGLETVSDRLRHVTAVTRKEQALENKILKKAVKAKKTANRRTASPAHDSP